MKEKFLENIKNCKNPGEQKSDTYYLNKEDLSKFYIRNNRDLSNVPFNFVYKAKNFDEAIEIIANRFQKTKEHILDNMEYKDAINENGDIYLFYAKITAYS